MPAWVNDRRSSVDDSRAFSVEPGVCPKSGGVSRKFKDRGPGGVAAWKHSPPPTPDPHFSIRPFCLWVFQPGRVWRTVLGKMIVAMRLPISALSACVQARRVWPRSSIGFFCSIFIGAGVLLPLQLAENCSPTPLCGGGGDSLRALLRDIGNSMSLAGASSGHFSFFSNSADLELSVQRHFACSVGSASM